MTSPSVSVILPTYNRAAVLQRSIDSVLNQSYRDLELIVVDDCSIDGTEQRLSEVTDSRLTIIKTCVNSGPAAARNVGIRASSGRYVAFQDSDTEWFPDKLTKEVALIEQPDQDGVYPAACYSRYILARGKEQTIIPCDPKSKLSGQIFKRLLYANTMGTPAILVRRNILDTVGYFDESLANLEDWDLALRISAGNSIAFLDEVNLIAYDSRDSVNKLISPESLAIIFYKHYDAYREYPEAMARVTWSIGSTYAMRRQKLEALQYMNMSIEQMPTVAKWMRFAVVYLGLNLYPTWHRAKSVLRPK